MPRILTLTPNPAVDVSTRTPRIEPVHKMRCAQPLIHPGGGGINVARVIARLGGEVAAMYPAGGATGERLHRLLQDEGVNSVVVPIAGETRESFTVVEEGSGHEYRFILPGPTLAPDEWQACLDRTVSAAQGCAVLVASGSLPPGVARDAYGQLARRISGRQLRFVLDSGGAALAAGLEAGVYLFKPSLRELQELVGVSLPDTPSRLAACRALIARRQAQLVALSLGAEGALLVSATQAWQAPALCVQVATTVGAGDSFLAGLVLPLALGQSLEAALRSGMAASAAALRRPGTALCLAQDVAALSAQVEIRALPMGA